MSTEPTASAAIPLSPLNQRFVLHWGEMGSRWGVNRSVAQIHALLFLIGRPLNAEQIADTLGLARSNISNSLRELTNWKLVQAVHQFGDRREHYATELDVWALFRVIVEERKAREFDPTVQMLQSVVTDPEFAAEAPDRQTRIRDTLTLMDGLNRVTDELLRLDPSTWMKLIRLSGRLQKLLRDA